ncbi:MAG: hypothetical protein GY749_44945 [Desulfobacteraceae bacterium]|nr:hypothetical protein [Desulfobacteraceae bacterium]
MSPGVGNFVDVANTALYGLRGKWKDFGFGAAAMLPVVGQGSTAAKYGKKGGKFIDEGIEAASKKPLLPDSYWINKKAPIQITPGQ